MHEEAAHTSVSSPRAAVLQLKSSWWRSAIITVSPNARAHTNTHARAHTPSRPPLDCFVRILHHTVGTQTLACGGGRSATCASPRECAALSSSHCTLSETERPVRFGEGAESHRDEKTEEAAEVKLTGRLEGNKQGGDAVDKYLFLWQEWREITLQSLSSEIFGWPPRFSLELKVRQTPTRAVDVIARLSAYTEPALDDHVYAQVPLVVPTVSRLVSPLEQWRESFPQTYTACLRARSFVSRHGEVCLTLCCSVSQFSSRRQVTLEGT